MSKQNKTNRKLLALLLTLVLVVGLIPASAFGGVSEFDGQFKSNYASLKGDALGGYTDENTEGVFSFEKVDLSQLEAPTYDLAAYGNREGINVKSTSVTSAEFDYVADYAQELTSPVGIVGMDNYGSYDEAYVFVWLQELPNALARVYQNEGMSISSYSSAASDAQLARNTIRGLGGTGGGISTFSVGGNITIDYEYSEVFAGFALRANMTTLSMIAEIPGVFAITEVTYESYDEYIADPNYTTPGNAGAREIMDIADLHAAGIDGRGVKVGVIDSGIQADHPDLAGAFAGGWNFAPKGTLNKGGRSDDMSTPDGNHGTHVSGTIASQGNTSLGVAPGVELYMAQVFTPDKPNSAATADTVAAIEAFSGGNPGGSYASHNLPKVDIINMSMGNTYNSAYEAGHVARNNAVIAGVLIVNSAGNNAYPESNTTDRRNYTLGSGGVSLPLSVAASKYGGNPILSYTPTVSNENNSETFEFYCENGDAALAGVFRDGSFGSTETRIVHYGPKAPSDSVFVHLERDYTIDPLVYVDGKGYELYYACANNVPTPGGTTASDMTLAEITALNELPEGYLTGKILVVNRGQAFFEYKCQALRLGAAGLIVINRDETVIGNLNIGSETSAKDLLVFSAPASFKQTLYDLAQGGAQTVYLDPGSLGKSQHVMEPADFSSIGPVNETAEIKPDVIAPGWSILSTDLDGGYTEMSGTSMSSPWVAGVAALVKQAFPSATPAEIKARIMNTADPDLIKPLTGRLSNPGYYFDANGTQLSVFEQGAGFVNPKRAASTDEAYITVANYDIPTGSTDKSTFDVAHMASFSFGQTDAGTQSKVLTATVNGGNASYISVVYNNNTRYSNKNLDNAVTVKVTNNGTSFDVCLDIAENACTDQLNGGNLYEGYIIVTVNGKDYVLPWATRVGNVTETESDYWLVFMDRPVQALRGSANQDFSPYSSQNRIYFMFEGKEIADSVALRTVRSGSTYTYYLDFYLIEKSTQRLSHRIAVGLGTSGVSTLKLSDFITIGAYYAVNWNGQANAITGSSVAGTATNVPANAYNIAIVSGTQYRWYGVFGFVISDTRPTLTVEDYTLTGNSKTEHEYAFGADKVTISGRLYSAATQLAAQSEFYWAGYYLLAYDSIFPVSQNLNVLVDAQTGYEYEFYNPLYGAEVPWLCDDNGYFTLTLPVNDDGYFFPEDTYHPSGVVQASEAFDVSRPWAGTTLYDWMLYGALKSYQWLPLTTEADPDVTINFPGFNGVRVDYEANMSWYYAGIYDDKAQFNVDFGSIDKIKVRWNDMEYYFNDVTLPFESDVPVNSINVIGIDGVCQLGLSNDNTHMYWFDAVMGDETSFDVFDYGLFNLHLRIPGRDEVTISGIQPGETVDLSKYFLPMVKVVFPGFDNVIIAYEAGMSWDYVDGLFTDEAVFYLDRCDRIRVRWNDMDYYFNNVTLDPVMLNVFNVVVNPIQVIGVSNECQLVLSNENTHMYWYSAVAGEAVFFDVFDYGTYNLHIRVPGQDEVTIRGIRPGEVVDITPEPTRISDAEFLQSIAADVLRNGLNNNNLVLEGNMLKLVFGDREIVLSYSANNANISGQVALGDGWVLVFDIKGNGSNIKEFRIYQQ